MASKALIILGAVTERSRNGTTGWESIPEALGIVVPTVTKNFVDVTSLDSEGYREYKPGLKDVSEVALPCNFTEEGYLLMLADEVVADAGDPIFYRTTFPARSDQATGAVVTFQAFPTPSIDQATDPDAKLTMTVNLRSTGKPTFVAGTALVP